MYRAGFKRAADVLASGLAILLLAPIFLAAGLAIWIDDGRPVLFRQTRVGCGGGPFTILKFRSMAKDAGDVPSDQAGFLAVTRVGRFLRRTNIDELPQLFNVLRGDMSLVGPRPSLPSQVELVTLRKRNGAIGLRPGLTGLAQIRSFDGMSAQEKAAFDGQYAANLSFWLDLKIILGTFAYLAHRPPTY